MDHVGVAKIDKLLNDRQDFVASAHEFERVWIAAVAAYQSSAHGTFGPHQAIHIELTSKVGFFFEGAGVSDGPKANDLLKGFDALMWAGLLCESRRYKSMPQYLRDEWEHSIQAKTTPEITRANIEKIFAYLYDARAAPLAPSELTTP